ncbi:tyrosine-type recombinase/integrase [Enterococcus sp. DIV0187]|uniref:tyrosine-type recombinase/integrase n=1 Tax=Enterococcus sp. DIV0187 TaxID=2774644 RepID=UPI003F1FCAF1
MDLNEKIKEYSTKQGKKRYISRNTYIGTYKDGSQKITDIRGKSKAEIRTKYFRFVHEFDPEEKSQVKLQIVTFRELYDLWLPQYKKGVKESTYRGTKKRVEKYVLPDLATQKISELTVLSLQKYYDKFMEKNGTKYYHQILQIISKIIRYGVSLGFVDQDPTEYVIKPKIERIKKERFYLSKEELKRLYKHLDSLDNRYINEVQKILFRMLAQSGMRISECCALEWGDLDFSGNTIAITKTFTFTEEGWKIGTPKNLASNRVIAMDKETMKRLLIFKEKQEHYFSIVEKYDEDFIFLSRNGNVLHNASVYDMLKRIIKKVGLPDINLHSLRHTHATLLFESGATPKEVQVRLGHSSIKTTMDTYTHIGEDRSQKTVDILMNYLGT